MTNISTTRLSSKGQVVIPEDIREKLGLHPGDQFVVFAEGDVVILKTIHAPSMKEFSGLISHARKEVKKSKLTKNSLSKTIKEARRK